MSQPATRDGGKGRAHSTKVCCIGPDGFAVCSAVGKSGSLSFPSMDRRTLPGMRDVARTLGITGGAMVRCSASAPNGFFASFFGCGDLVRWQTIPSHQSKSCVVYNNRFGFSGLLCYASLWNMDCGNLMTS